MLVNPMKDNFTQVSNEIVINTNISNGALRVYLYISSKPTGWNVFNKDIQKQLDRNLELLKRYEIEAQTEQLIKEFHEMREVLEIYILYGEWDILLKIKLKSLPELTKFVLRLRKIEGVNKTNTLITTHYGANGTKQ